MTVTALPTGTTPGADPERYLTRAQLADVLAVSTDTVDRFRKEGMPHETWGLASPRFLLSRVAPWLRDREHRSAA